MVASSLSFFYGLFQFGSKNHNGIALNTKRNTAMLGLDVINQKRLLILLKTLSPGTALTAPDQSSDKRFPATEIHFSSIDESRGFKLFKIDLTTIVLSSIGREITSAFKSFILILISSFLSFFPSCDLNYI